jgi:hypothetical protein
MKFKGIHCFLWFCFFMFGGFFMSSHLKFLTSRKVKEVLSISAFAVFGFYTGFFLTALNGCQAPKVERATLDGQSFEADRVLPETQVSEDINYENPSSSSLLRRNGGSGNGAGVGSAPRSASGSVAGTSSGVKSVSSGEVGFCQGFNKGECLTFVLQIPSPDMQLSLGLSALSIMHHSPGYKGLLERACNIGIFSSMPSLVNDSGVNVLQRQGVGKKLFSGVKKSRCIIQNLKTDSDPLPILEPHELGFSARLVEIEMVSQNMSTQPAFGTFQFENTKLNVSFHEPQVFAKNNLGVREWIPVQSWRIFGGPRVFGVAKKSIGMTKNISFKADVNSSAAYLQKILMPSVEAIMKGQGYGSLAAQVFTLKSSLEVLFAKGAATAAKGNAALMVGALAVSAVRDICTFEKSDCRIKAENKNLVAEIDSFVGRPDAAGSDVRVAFSDALKFLPYSIISAIIEEADKKNLLTRVL